MDWSQRFRAYIDKRFGSGAQQKAAFALRVSPSVVSYWCRGSLPRKRMRGRIARWSKGEVPAEPVTTESGPLPVEDESDHARTA
jgi:hypothetical protein